MDFSLRIPDMNKPVFLAIATAGCSKAENANNAGSNTYDASPVPEKTLSGIEESTSGNTDNAENDALDTSPESDTTVMKYSAGFIGITEGKKSIVWRCISRLENTGLFCTASTILEDTLKEKIVEAINIAVSGKNSFLAILKREY
jgi:hypothetical protein